MSGRWIVVTVVVVLAGAAFPLLAASNGQNPMAGTWEITLQFDGGSQPEQSYELVLLEDGHWYCTAWGTEGYWARPDARTLTLSGERTVEAGVTEAFAITGARIVGHYRTIKGSFVLWRQPSWSQVQWHIGDVSGTRE